MSWRQHWAKSTLLEVAGVLATSLLPSSLRGEVSGNRPPPLDVDASRFAFDPPGNPPSDSRHPTSTSGVSINPHNQGDVACPSLLKNVSRSQPN